MKRAGARELGVPQAFWDALRRDEPDPRAVERAYRRFVEPPRPLSAPRLVLARWLLAGFVLGWGVVYAATGDPLFGAQMRAPPSATPSGTPNSAPQRRISAHRHGLPESNASASPSVESPPPEATSSSSIRLAAPAPSIPAESAPPDPKWQRAALALKAHDLDEAEAALSSLESRGSPADREAASLALAEVLLARGRSDAARVRLERLSATARSPLTRDKARALLANPAFGGERSTDTAPGTQ